MKKRPEQNTNERNLKRQVALYHDVVINKSVTEQYKGIVWFKESLTSGRDVKWNDSVK